MNLELPVIDRKTFDRYTGLSLPRHVAYPMPSWWNEVNPAEAGIIRTSCLSDEEPRDLSLYLHLPFCEHVCRFCACNKVPLKRKAAHADRVVETYIDAIITEGSNRASFIDAIGRSGRRGGVISSGFGGPVSLMALYSF